MCAQLPRIFGADMDQPDRGVSCLCRCFKHGLDILGSPDRDHPEIPPDVERRRLLHLRTLFKLAAQRKLF
jgi:hypothetical protein